MNSVTLFNRIYHRHSPLIQNMRKLQHSVCIFGKILDRDNDENN